MVRQISDTEGQAYVRFCQERGIVLDGEDGIFNGNFVRDYFLNTWNGTIITAKTLEQAFPQLKSDLKFHTESELEFSKIYNALSVAEKQAFANWKWPFGVIQNELNGFVLLKWLKAHNFDVTERNLSFATGQAKVTGLLQWDEQAIRQKPKPDKGEASQAGGQLSVFSCWRSVWSRFPSV